jgi:asparagine synthase (glutamine-hydrolysing)
MLEAAPHRGSALTVAVTGNAAVGVSAGSEAGAASLDASDGVVTAVAGVVDNAAELGAELGLPAGATPAAIVAGAIRAWGQGAPGRLRGCFSVVHTDGRELHAFRDHLGFGPLFYRTDGRGVVVASEAKQVVAGSGIAREPDLDVVERIFYQRFDDDMPSALAGVERLPKATALESDGRTLRRRRYWDPGALLETARYDDDELHERFDALMAQAAARVVTGRDAVSLSGGIDSPAVAAYAAPVHSALGSPLQAVSVVYPRHPSVDERRYTELVAHRLGLPLHVYEQTASPLADLDAWMALADGPVPTIALALYAQHYRTIRSLGPTTVLSGELAEFVFDVPAYLLVHLLSHRRWAGLGRHLRARRASGTSSLALARQLAAVLVPLRITARRWSDAPGMVPSWVDRRRANAAAVASLVPASKRWSKVQLSAFDGPGLTAEADEVCQNVCGVRARRPFADVDLWELFLSLPAETKYPTPERKALVRRLLRGRVPDEILDRRDKTLFDAAVQDAIDYPTIERWLAMSSYRLPGVDYDALFTKLDRRELALSELLWVKDLASVHAFLSQW